MSWPDVIWGLITGMLLLHACSLAHQHFTGYAPPEFIVIGDDEMGRLTDKLAAAAAVAPRQAAKSADRLEDALRYLDQAPRTEPSHEADRQHALVMGREIGFDPGEQQTARDYFNDRFNR